MRQRIFLSLMVAAALAAFLSACASIDIRTQSQALLDRMAQATVGVRSSAGRGSGVLVGRRTVLTIGHVVATRQQAVKVTFEDGRVVDGTRIFLSRRPDVALIRLNRDVPFRIATVACARLPLDAPVIVISNPGLMRWFIGHGYVASTHRVVNIPFDQLVLSVAIIPGSSGGPVFDQRGRIRGLIRAGISRGGIPLPGFTFAVPAREFCDIPQVRAEIVRAS